MRILLVTMLLLALVCPCMAEPGPLLRISGPPIAESLPLLAMEQPQPAWRQDFSVQFTPWHSPDMLRAMVAGRQLDAAIITTATACTLRNKGINCRIALLHEAPVWIVSTRPGPNTLESLQGTLLFPFGPGEMPELFYKATMVGKPEQVSIQHTGGALEAVNLLLVGKGDHVMLSEPTASIALLRSRTMNSATPLVKRVNMCEAWARTFPGHRLASCCIAVFGSKAEDHRLIEALGKAYEQACLWIRENPKKSLGLARDRFPTLATQIEHGLLNNLDIHILKGDKARTDALFYLKKISEISPAAIGGTMPGNDLFEMAP